MVRGVGRRTARVAVRYMKRSSVAGVVSSGMSSRQSGSSSSNARGSITAPERMWAPISPPFSTRHTAASGASCLSLMAAAKPAGPPPTTSTSNSIASRCSASDIRRPLLVLDWSSRAFGGLATGWVARKPGSGRYLRSDKGRNEGALAMAAEVDRDALLAALRLQMEWGADEALAEAPLDRTALAAAPSPPPTGAPTLPNARAAAAVVPGVRSAPGGGNSLLVPAAAPPGASRAAELADAAGSLEALREAMAAFEGSSLRETATNLVFADGAAGSGLMLIGEAPGADEDRLGLPFVGVSGRLMDRMLLSIGLRRERDFYVTNILPFRPPGNRTPTDAEIALFLPFVLRHVELAAPRLLVLLGGTSAKALLRSREGITRLRGRWHEVAPRGAGGGVPWPALATLHPAYLLRNPAAKKDAWHDLLLLRRRLDQEGAR